MLENGMSPNHVEQATSALGMEIILRYQILPVPDLHRCCHPSIRHQPESFRCLEGQNTGRFRRVGTAQSLEKQTRRGRKLRGLITTPFPDRIETPMANPSPLGRTAGLPTE